MIKKNIKILSEVDSYGQYPDIEVLVQWLWKQTPLDALRYLVEKAEEEFIRIDSMDPSKVSPETKQLESALEFFLKSKGNLKEGLLGKVQR